MIRRLLFLAFLVAAPLHAQAQERAIPRNAQWTPPPMQRGYYSKGWVRAPISAEYGAFSGDGWSYTAGGVGMGFHVGVTQKWFFDINGSARFGQGRVTHNGHDVLSDDTGLHGGAFAGRKLWIGRKAFIVGYGGATWGSTSLSYTHTDGVNPDNYNMTTTALSTPAGIYATIGREIQVSPFVQANYVWGAHSVLYTGYDVSPPEKDVADSPAWVSYSAGIDVGSAKTGVYGALLAQLTPAVEDEEPYTAIFVRLTWSLKLSKATGVQ